MGGPITLCFGHSLDLSPRDKLRPLCNLPRAVWPQFRKIHANYCRGSDLKTGNPKAGTATRNSALRMPFVKSKVILNEVLAFRYQDSGTRQCVLQTVTKERRLPPSCPVERHASRKEVLLVFLIGQAFWGLGVIYRFFEENRFLEKGKLFFFKKRALP